jgi:putative pyruvate formate lyase activating enzyme
MSDLARLRIWDDPAIRGALSVPGRRREPAPAKFRIAATVAARLNPLGSSEDALWAELDRLTPIFLVRWQAIRAGAALPEAADGPSLLELCRELAYRMLAHCNFCPCRVDRMAGAKYGACKLATGGTRPRRVPENPAPPSWHSCGVLISAHHRPEWRVPVPESGTERTAGR